MTIEEKSSRSRRMSRATSKGKNRMASWPRVLTIAVLANFAFRSEHGSSDPYEPRTGTERNVGERATGVVEQARRSAEPAQSMPAAGGRAWSFRPLARRFTRLCLSGQPVPKPIPRSPWLGPGSRRGLV